MTVFDQYEVEPLLMYSGSTFDHVLLGGFFSGSSNIAELEKVLVGSTVKASPLLAITASFITTASLRVFTYNSNTTSISLTDPVRQVPVRVSDLVRLYSNGYVGTGAKYSVGFSTNERFTDSVMPEPTLVYLSGVVDAAGGPSSNFAEENWFFRRIRARARNQFLSSSCMILCGGDLPVPELLTLNLGAGNQVWQNDFPFEPKYKRITKNFNINTQKTVGPLGTAFIFNNPSPGFGTWTLFAGGSALPQKFRNSMMYWGYSALSFGYSSFNTGSIYPLPTNKENVSRSCWELEDFAFSGSLTSSAGKVFSLPWVSGVAEPPNPEMFNLHFFGFGKMFGKFAEPAVITASIAFAAASESVPNRDFPVTSGTFVGIRLDGYKYGVYSPIPAYSKAVFRRSHFGFFRDMLEQRPNTAFFNEKRGVSRETVVTINFLTSSQAYLTASSPDPYLNARSSGMFDFGYRAGRPFFE